MKSVKRYRGVFAAFLLNAAVKTGGEAEAGRAQAICGVRSPESLTLEQCHFKLL